MANLYVWFGNETERREFVMELLELKPAAPTGRSRKVTKVADSLQQSLDSAILEFESGRTKSPWYQLHRIFYNGRVPQVSHRISPWAKEAVFEKLPGFTELRATIRRPLRC